MMKCFEKLVLKHIQNNFPASLNTHQFAFRTNRSTEDAISTALHSVFIHFENKTCIRLLFVNFSSAFNKMFPIKLNGKLTTGLEYHSLQFFYLFPNGLQTVWIGPPNPLKCSTPEPHRAVSSASLDHKQ